MPSLNGAPSKQVEKAPASRLIGDLADTLKGDTVTVGELLKLLEGRGLGLVLLILSLPICIPNIPGISTLFGLLLLGPALQMIFGHKTVWMPGFSKQWRFKGDSLRGALRATGKLMRKIEILARPRLTGLTLWPVTSLIGLQTLLMALILLLPMPGANILPGIAVTLTGLALLQRDGLSMLLGVVFAAISVAWVYYGGRYVIEWSLKAYTYAVEWGEKVYEHGLSYLQGWM